MLRQAQALERLDAPPQGGAPSLRSSAYPPPDPHQDELTTGLPVLPDGQEHLQRGHDGQPYRLTT